MGLGYSEIPEHQDLAPTQQVAMLAALLDRLSINRVDLVANDSGGAVAQLFVARYPHRVRTLLLTNCDVVIDSPPAAFKLSVLALSHAGQFADKFIAPMLANPSLARSPKGTRGARIPVPNEPDRRSRSRATSRPSSSSPVRKAQLHGYALGLEQNPLTGVEPALRQTTMPVRILWGTADTIFSPEEPDYELDHAFHALARHPPHSKARKCSSPRNSPISSPRRPARSGKVLR